MAMGHEFEQRRHREIGRAHEDQTERHEAENPGTMSVYSVMAGLVPAIHVFGAAERKTWMPGTSPGMTVDRVAAYSTARLAAFVNFFSTRSRFSFDR